MAKKKFYHTINDTRKLEMRLMLNGVPYPLDDGAVATLYMNEVGKEEKVINGGAMVPDADQTLRTGVVRMDWAPHDATLYEGLFEARVVTVKLSGERQTFPTGDFNEKTFLITVNGAA